MKRPGDLKRVLFVSPFDEPVSGADESLLLLISRLDRNHLEPHVLVPWESRYKERYEKAGAILHTRPMARMRRNYSPLFWIEQLRRLRRELRELPLFLTSERIDLIHANMHVVPGVMIAARRLKIPFILHYRAKTNDKPKAFFDLFIPWLYARSSEVICISEAVAAHFRKRGLSEHTHVVPNPVDLERILRPSVRNPWAEFESLRGKKVILFIGRIDPQKRIHVLLEAVERLGTRRNDIGLAILGDEAVGRYDRSYYTGLRAKAGSLHVPVEWIPHQPDVESFLRSSSLFVLPSVNEGFGRVIVEAMAAGVPVVGARSGAIPELLENGKWGQLFTPDDPEEFADAMDRGLSESRFLDLARRAAEHAKENFSIARHVSRLMEIYEPYLS